MWWNKLDIRSRSHLKVKGHRHGRVCVLLNASYCLFLSSYAGSYETLLIAFRGFAEVSKGWIYLNASFEVPNRSKYLFHLNFDVIFCPFSIYDMTWHPELILTYILSHTFKPAFWKPTHSHECFTNNHQQLFIYFTNKIRWEEEHEEGGNKLTLTNNTDDAQLNRILPLLTRTCRTRKWWQENPMT